MPHADARADEGRLPLVDVHDRGVLDVGRFPNHDRCHVTEHHRPRRNERGRIDPRLWDYWRTGWNGHCTHASVGSPFFWAGFQRRRFAISSASLLNVSTLDVA